MTTLMDFENFSGVDIQGNVIGRRIPYGKAPVYLGSVKLKPEEHMLYLYLPVKFPGDPRVYLPKNLVFCDKVVALAMADAHSTYGVSDKYVYITAKTIWVGPNNPGNRPGWHADGFGSGGDLNYIWYDLNPTQFAVQPFENVSEEDCQCLADLETQVNPEFLVVYPPHSVLRLDESVVHRVHPNPQEGLRTFIKVSISQHKYNLKGNSHNYLVDYEWEMFDRLAVRNTDNKDFVKKA